MKSACIPTTESKEAVMKSEALFQALVQNSTDIFILTNRFFKLDYISDAVTKILGYYPDELTGRQGFEIIHPDDKETFAVWLARIMETTSGIAPLEFRAKTSIGNWVYLEASGKNMLEDEEVSGLVISCRDIHAKKIADEALIQAEQRLTLLLNNTKESFIILNNKLRVIAYNKAAQEHSTFFFRTEIQSGLSFMDLVDTAEMDNYINLFEKVVRGKEQHLDTVHTDKHGGLHTYHHTFRALNLGNEGQGIFITSSDITEMQQAEIAMKESEEKFKAIIEYSFDAVIIVDEEGIIKYASPSIAGLLGFTADELIGRNGFELVHPLDTNELQAKLLSIVNDMEETYADYRSLTKDGGIKWLEAKGKNMLHNKHINGILVSLRDISQRKKMIEEQTALTNELVKYNKDLQQFSFITSHNLRAPVANLQSLLSLYNRKDLADTFNAELLEKMDECTNQLNETLNDLINVLVIRSRPDAEVEQIRFADVTEQVIKNVQSLLKEKSGEVITDFTQAASIEYSRVHMESILLNLMTNSIKYSSPGRKLRIDIITDITDEGTRLIFTDNGVGIDLDRYGDRIFGLYQRFHSGKQGKGLGLYMIKSQILASGGSIKVKSEPGEGTSFIIHFKHRKVS